MENAFPIFFPPCTKLRVKEGFPSISVVKNLPPNAGDQGVIPGSGRSPGEGNSNSLQYSCLGNPMKRRLAGCSPWSHKRLRHDLATKQM